jgi:hypothetical protein
MRTKLWRNTTMLWGGSQSRKRVILAIGGNRATNWGTGYFQNSDPSPICLGEAVCDYSLALFNPGWAPPGHIISHPDMNLQPSHATVSTCKQKAPGQIQRPGVQREPNYALLTTLHRIVEVEIM